MDTITINVIRTSIEAMERRNDVPKATIDHYRSLIVEHGSHDRPSTICDCYYGMVE